MNIKQIIPFFSLIFCLSTTVYATCDKPKVIKHLENYSIIATNRATINTAFAFSGTHLNYSISAHPKNPKNRIKVNTATGQIKITAEKQDQFDIKVKAKNTCGAVTAGFNVEIDEEE